MLKFHLKKFQFRKTYSGFWQARTRTFNSPSGSFSETMLALGLTPLPRGACQHPDIYMVSFELVVYTFLDFFETKSSIYTMIGAYLKDFSCYIPKILYDIFITYIYFLSNSWLLSRLWFYWFYSIWNLLFFKIMKLIE